MKKFILLLIPVLTILYSLDALFLDIHYEYELFPIYSDSETNPILEAENFHIQYGNGLVQYIYKIHSVLGSLNDPDLPLEGDLERTRERLEKILISREISLSIYTFIIILSISTIFSFTFHAWFSIFLGRFTYFFSSLVAFLNLVRALIHFKFIPNYALMSAVFHLFYFGFSIYCFFIVKKYLLSKDILYNSLYIASLQSDESGSGKVSLPYEQKLNQFSHSFREKLKDFFYILFVVKFRIAYHFLVIIFVGFLLGNLVYIPLFSLQKHYTKEFGYLLGASIVLLSLFYIRNYYLIGKEKENGIFANLAVSFAFLVYRFLRNLSLFLLISLGILLFVLGFLFLLNWNISLLIENQLIEKTVRL